MSNEQPDIILHIDFVAIAHTRKGLYVLDTIVARVSGDDNSLPQGRELTPARAEQLEVACFAHKARLEFEETDDTGGPGDYMAQMRQQYGD